MSVPPLRRWRQQRDGLWWIQPTSLREPHQVFFHPSTKSSSSGPPPAAPTFRCTCRSHFPLHAPAKTRRARSHPKYTTPAPQWIRTSSPTLERFTLGTTDRELVIYFSEGVAALEPSALTLSSSRNDSGLLSASGGANVSLLCSAAGLGRRQGSSNSASRREIVLRLDEPCATVVASAASNTTGATNSSSAFTNTTLAATNENDAVAATFVGGYASDWSKLVATGLVVVDGEEDVGLGSPLLLNATSDLVADLSAAANPVVAVTNLAQSFPGK